jgi:hypothetical protein
LHAWSWYGTPDDQGGRVNGPIPDAADGRTEHIVNALVVPQGPNYALAKTLQHWRAVVERCVACPVITVRPCPAPGFGERLSERQSADNHLILSNALLGACCRDQGHLVSSNIAPSTATISVVHNRSFAWAYGGYPYFVPMEIFNQEACHVKSCGPG